MSTGLEFNPGREATTDGARPAERDRRRVRRDLHEPRPQPRLAAPATRSRSSSRSPATAGSGPRSRTSTCATTRARPSAAGSAPSRRWRRRARSRAWTCSPTRRRSVDGLGQLAGILPPWVGRRRGGGRARATCAIPTTRKRLRTECDRYWRFIHKGEWDRVRLQASEQHPEWDGLTFAQIADLRRPIRGTATSTCSPEPAPAFESVLVVGEALHRRAHRGDDLAPALLPRRRHVHGHAGRPARRQSSRHPLGYAGHVHYLTHHVARERHAAARGGDPEDDEHAGRALRPLGSRSSCAPGLRRGRRRLRLRRARRGLDASTTRSTTCEGVEHVLVNGVAVVDAGEHTGARPGRHLLRS